MISPAAIGPTQAATEAPTQAATEAATQAIDDAVARGAYGEAAALAEHAGAWARAADLHERVWAFTAAAEAAGRAAAWPRALALALEGNQAEQIARMAAALTRTPEGIAQAIELYRQHRRFADAARLLDGTGETLEAARLFERAGDLRAAAARYEAGGRDRDAGRLYERVLDLGSDDDRAQAHLALGRIHATHGAFADAARHLQLARTHPATRADALAQLVTVLVSMGLRDGAREVLHELSRARDEALDLDAFLRDARRPAARTDAPVLLGRYRVLRSLGAGAAGRVVLAHDEVADREVAAKIMYLGDARGAPAYERFVRETRVVAGLAHPGIVGHLEVALDQGIVVMEFMVGGSLATRLAAGPLPERQVRRLALELLAALEFTHARGVIHRDIKPANIFFDAAGGAKLGDFGIAHLTELGQTMTGGMIGTLAYMAPEQVTAAHVSPATDLYALGITLFEALTGRLPFLGPDFVAQHLGTPAPRPSSVMPTLDPTWDEVLGALLAKAPSDRTHAATEVRDRLLASHAAPRPMLLPRRVAIDTAADVASHTGEPATDAADEAPPRLEFETALPRGPHGSLSRALDQVLGRAVVIERLDDDPVRPALLQRARAFARVASPFVQRVLGLDATTGTITYEAIIGTPWRGDLFAALPRDARLRLCKRLTRALMALHRHDVGYGWLDASTVSVDDQAIPCLRTVGLPGPPPTHGVPTDDVVAAIALWADALGVPATWPAVAGALAEAAYDGDVPITSLALYAALDQLEIAHYATHAPTGASARPTE